MASNDNDEVPSDIVFEIISRTPSLATLDSCKTVCKEWKQMIYEANFMPLYCKRTKNVSGYFVQDMINCKYISEFVSLDHGHDHQGSRGGMMISRFPDEKYTRILASCRQGLLCCVRRVHHNKYRYYACKPTTGQWQPLPNPRRHWNTVAVAIMVLGSSPLRYKIVRLSTLPVHMYCTCTYRCDIFDSKAWKWRTVADINLPYSELINPSSQSTTAANSSYWLTSDDNVIEFRQADESCHKLRLPKLVHNNAAYRSKILVEYQGGLGLVCLSNDNYFELWVKELGSTNIINNNVTWSKKMEVDLKRVERYAFPLGFYNAGIVFLKAYFEVIFYKLQDSSQSRVKLDRLRTAGEVFQFRSDFERVELGRTS